MLSQSNITSVTQSGNFTSENGALASFNVVNDANLVELSQEYVDQSAAEIAAFLLNVVPASVLSHAIDLIVDDVNKLGELGDKFDELAFNKITESVDPGLNAYLVQKIQLWNSGVNSTTALLSFIKEAINYADAGHKELY